MEPQNVLSPSAPTTDQKADDAAAREARHAVDYAGLQAALASRDNRIAELETALNGLQEQAAGMAASHRQAVTAYARLASAAVPGILPEMVTGETIEEVDASLARARSLIERVREEIEAGLTHEAVPAGAPPRQTAPVTGFTAAEKIRYAVSRAGRR